MRQARLDALTTLRFVAAALIVVHHAEREFGIGHTLDLTAVLDQAVSFFFVLSGFILAYVYRGLDAGGVRRFLVARLARLWPLHVATFALVVALLPANDRPWGLGAALANLALVHAWIPGNDWYFSFNGPSWSISTEAGFYVLFPLLVRDLERTWAGKLALAAAVLAAVVAFCNVRLLAEPALWVVPYVHPLARLPEFVLGMTGALAWRRLAPRLRAAPAAATAAEVLLLALAAVVMARTNAWLVALRVWESPLGIAGAIWLTHAGICAAGFAALIAVVAAGAGRVSRALSAAPCVLLGEISYAVYLLHYPMLRWYHAHRAAFADVPVPVAYAIFWLVLLLASHVVWSLLEQPSRRALRRAFAGDVSRDPPPLVPRRFLVTEALALGAVVAAIAIAAARG